MSILDHLTAITWPEDTYTVTWPDGTVETFTIRGIPLAHPDYVRYVYAPYYLEDDGTLADAISLLQGEMKSLSPEQAKRIAKALGLARRPVETPQRETTSRMMAAAVIMGTLGEDGRPAFGWRSGEGIPKASADRLRSLLPLNDLAAWGNKIFDLSAGHITREDVEEGKASSDDEATSETSTG